MDDKKKQELKKIFWDMNTISYEVKDENNNTSYEISFDNPQDKITKKVLYIKITHKTVDEMMNMYFLNPMQKEQIKNAHPSLSDSTINRALVSLKNQNKIRPNGTGRSATWVRLVPEEMMSNRMKQLTLFDILMKDNEKEE